MKFKLLVYILILNVSLMAQVKDVDISPLIGNTYRSFGDEIHPEDEEFVIYKIFTENEILIFGYFHRKGREYRQDIDSISAPKAIESLEWYFGDPNTISEDGFVISGGAVWRYDKIDSLPYPIYKKLFKSQYVDDRNYFNDFLKKTVRSVCTPQVDIFDAKDEQSKGYLVQGDLVEVLEESGDWVKVKYLKTNLEYWTYQSCLE